MKKIGLMTLAAAAASFALTSCGGSSAPSSLLFGKVPGIVTEFQAERDRMKNELSQCKSQSDGLKLIADFEALEAETFAKAEEAGKAWSGTTLEVESNELFEVKTPVTVTFDGFFSKSDMTAKYTLAGEIVVAKECIWEPVKKSDESVIRMIQKEGIKPYNTIHVEVIGLDADGNELVRNRIGYVQLALIGDRVGVRANTPIQFESLVMKKKSAAEYPKVKSLKLGFAENVK